MDNGNNENSKSLPEIDGAVEYLRRIAGQGLAAQSSPDRQPTRQGTSPSTTGASKKD
jgi:hypothetical protein